MKKNKNPFDKTKLFQCDLCVLEEKTRWYYQSEKIVVCDCTTCKIPMVLLRRHTMNPTQEELDEVNLVCDILFGRDDYDFRKNQRRIPDHLHWHIIKKEKEKNAECNRDKVLVQEVQKTASNSNTNLGT